MKTVAILAALILLFVVAEFNAAACDMAALILSAAGILGVVFHRPLQDLLNARNDTEAHHQTSYRI